MTAWELLFTENRNGNTIADKIDATGDCWQWTAATHHGGYGSIRWQGRHWPAHRLVWSLLVGPIPDGMFVDHMCRNHSCVNPDHLRIVTPRINAIENSLSVGAANTRKTHCPKGHQFSIDNIIYDNDRRRCRTCRNTSRRMLGVSA